MENSELIELAEQCGRAHMSKEDTDIILGTEPVDMSDTEHAYTKGRLLSEMRVRLSIMEQAQNGSSPAQALAMDIIRHNRAKDA